MIYKITASIKRFYRFVIINCVLLILFYPTMMGCVKVEKRINIEKSEEDLTAPCCKDFSELYSICEYKLTDECIERVNYLLNNKYNDDSALLSLLAFSAAQKGDKNMAISFFEKSLRGKYSCVCVSPKGDFLLIERAMFHFCISMLSQEIGDIEKSVHENAKGVELLKKVSMANVNESYIKKIQSHVRKSLNFLQNHPNGEW